MKDTGIAKLMCPYCESPFDSKEALSTHIDNILIDFIRGPACWKAMSHVCLNRLYYVLKEFWLVLNAAELAGVAQPG